MQKQVINLIKNGKNNFLSLKVLKNTESAQLCMIQCCTHVVDSRPRSVPPEGHPWCARRARGAGGGTRPASSWPRRTSCWPAQPPWPRRGSRGAWARRLLRTQSATTLDKTLKRRKKNPIISTEKNQELKQGCQVFVTEKCGTLN